MKKMSMLSGVALGACATSALYMMMNKDVRNKAEDMIECAAEETRNYFAEM